MAKIAVALRLPPETLEWLDGYAKARGSSRQVVLEAAVESFRADVLGGVPDLPAAPAPKPIPGLRRASSLEARRRANPSGMDRQARIEKARES